MKENQMLSMRGAKRMTSLEIAEVTGKQHKDVMRAIRNMESAWEKECGRKFALTSQPVEMPNGGVRMTPCYNLTKLECLYIATKFNDEARARLVLRWEELERTHPKQYILDGRLLEAKDVIKLKCDELRREEIEEENAPSDGCLTATEIASLFNMTVKQLNKLLKDEGIQSFKKGSYCLTPSYENQGLAQYRYYHYYSLKGEKRERPYMVWTKDGCQMIAELIARIYY